MSSNNKSNEIINRINKLNTYINNQESRGTYYERKRNENS